MHGAGAEGRIRPSANTVEVTPDQVQPFPLPSMPQMVTGRPAAADQRSLLGASNYAATKRHVSLARNWVRTIFADVVDDDTLYDLSLCADEMVDNGRKHGRQDGVISVAAYLTLTTAQLEVTNDGPGDTFPHVTSNTVTEEGHGLMIVAALSARCGRYLNHDRDQVVWCEFPIKAQTHEGSPHV
ncbi:MAG TPA: ATP-binding protein [Streptosporangiaceae bacterium]|nr:ATP-binding protein [Streptosporangiaceae bacterium]